MELPPYTVLEKHVGQTPLACVETWRKVANVAHDVPLAYAGRLDPMASGKLLILIGDECKNQALYHGLDKAYEFSVLFGIGSDTHDVLGRLSISEPAAPSIYAGSRSETGLVTKIQNICNELTGEIELAYPLFSSKTIKGKPLLLWTLEDRLGEITIPTKQSTVYSIKLANIETKTRTEICTEARTKIDLIPPVIETSKAIGNDFRRTDIRQDWKRVELDSSLPDYYQIANFECIASSGTYMRTLASVIGEKMKTNGLAWHIHRTEIGTYDPTVKDWSKKF